MPDETPARIRWQPEPGLFAGFSGYAGTVEPALFRIYDPEAPDAEHALCSMLPGMGNKASYGTEAEVKARAEEWLAEFIASLGAAFRPAVAEWAVRVKIDAYADAYEYARRDEDEARTYTSTMRDKHPDWELSVVSRVPAIPAGPWEVTDGG